MFPSEKLGNNPLKLGTNPSSKKICISLKVNSNKKIKNRKGLSVQALNKVFTEVGAALSETIKSTSVLNQTH